jgi:alpha-ketoglutarate-dependent taurine dioxygenase
MQTRLHENGWTVYLEDFDYAAATQKEINQIAKLTATNLCVVAKNQNHLTNSDRRRVAHMFGGVANWNEWVADNDHRARYLLKDVDAGNEIQILTGALASDGRPGLFGRSQTQPWHSDRPQDKNRSSLTWINAISGSQGSRTSFSNQILAYKDLPNNIKNQIKDLHSIYRFNTELTLRADPDIITIDEADLDWRPPVVYTNIAGATGLFLSWTQIDRFEEMDKDSSWSIIYKIRDHILNNEQYIYHHDWEDGDVVISEQWLSNHVRWAFDGIEHRIVYRMTFDYDNITL